MNKRNFGRVIKRIEVDPTKWNQRIPPFCGTPYCFLGHARAIFAPRSPRTGTRYSKKLQQVLGLSFLEMDRLFDSGNTMRDFKRWHKQGSVS